MDIVNSETGYVLTLNDKEKEYLIEAINQPWAKDWVHTRLLTTVRESETDLYTVMLTEVDRSDLYREIDGAACTYEESVIGRKKSGHFASVLQARLTFVKISDEEYKRFLCSPPPEQSPQTIFIEHNDSCIQPDPTDKTFLLMEREALLADAERLNWLQKQLEKKSYTGKCVFRWSTNGRGFRLHETSEEATERFGITPVDSVREAIDQAMREANESNSGRIEGDSETEDSKPGA